MCFLFSGVFWGIVLVLLGITVIINVVFHVHIPFFRIVFALIIIYIGLKVLTGGHWGICRPKANNENIVFAEATITPKDAAKDYSIIFGKGVIDLSDSLLGEKGGRFRVKTVFGDGKIVIGKTVPTTVEVSSAFAAASMPDKNMITFGKYSYNNKAVSDSIKPVSIEASVVFGNLEIVEK
jgi:predicted membrane protein